MFPPGRTEDLREALKGLFESLQRGGDFFTGSGSVEQPEKNKFVVKMVMHTDPGPKVRDAMCDYIRPYVKECGWTVRGVTFEGRTLRLKLRPRK
jgi:hypothetical protein